MVSELGEQTFKMLRELIYQRSGLFFSDTKKYLLESKLRAHVEALGFKGFEEYLYMLRYSSDGIVEFAKLLDYVTTGETCFFRDPAQMSALQKVILPWVIDRNKESKKLYLWSAGCSTGEEPFTLAIMLKELLGPSILSWHLKIVANDISRLAITKARQLTFNEYSMRYVPDELISKYFKKQSDKYLLNPDIADLVEFHVANLLNPERFCLFNQFDVILCRNVLIYFQMESRRKAVQIFYDKLVMGGYLLIGFSEILHGITRSFKIIHYPGTVFYQKQE
jgi:chemotaxis protein methyltransferase CheR